MKISPLFLVFGIAGIALGGCHLYNNDNNNTACAGYIGCSALEARKDGGIGIMPNSGAGGAGGAGGASGSMPLHQINLGCNKAPPANQVETEIGTPVGYTHFTVMATGATLQGTLAAKAGPRTFWVRIPANYDQTHHYRVQYVGQGCGGYEVANISTVQFFDEKAGGDEEVIYVALDIPRDMANQDCYDNNAGPKSQEWEAFQLFQTFVDGNYCVDNDRVYVSGYSTGGWLTDMWGCYFAGDGQHPYNGVVPMTKAGSTAGGLTSRANAIGDAGTTDAPGSDAMSMSGSDAAVTSDASAVAETGGGGATDAADDSMPYVPTAGFRMFAPEYHIRGQFGISGSEPPNNPPCNGPVAAIWIHDVGDPNPYAGNHVAALGRVLTMNGCFSANPPTMPWHEDIMGKGVCVKYTDCPVAYPVVFCTTFGQGHMDQHGIAIPGFTTFAKELETAAGLDKMLP